MTQGVSVVSAAPDAGPAAALLKLSARGYHRVLRVARTAADLAGSDGVRTEDVSLALLMRSDP